MKKLCLGLLLCLHLAANAQLVDPEKRVLTKTFEQLLASESAVEQAVYLIAGNRLGLLQANIDNTQVIDQLRALENQPFYGLDAFERQVKSTIGADLYKKYRTPILAISIAHPFPNPRPAAPTDLSKPDSDGFVWPSAIYGLSTAQNPNGGPERLIMRSASPMFPPALPLVTPPGSNFLPTIYTDMFDSRGQRIANSLPSTQRVPYNLHPTPKTQPINRISPTDDLRLLFYLALYRLTFEPDVQAAVYTPTSKQVIETTELENNLIVAHKSGDSALVAEIEAQLRLFSKRNPLGVPVIGPLERETFAEDARDAALFDDAAIQEIAQNLLNSPLPQYTQDTDLSTITEGLKAAVNVDTIAKRILDILEGSPIPNRTYSGFPLLHFHGPNKIKRVEPIREGDRVVGGNINVRQLWYDNHIESDTALINPIDVWDAPWTVTYTVDVLNRGEDDFSPFAMYTDDPANSLGLSDKQRQAFKRTSTEIANHLPPGDLVDPENAAPNDWTPWAAGDPHIGMDQTFFPMEDGVRYVFKVKMPPGKYYHLIYTWGWRWHPPRIQVADRATKNILGATLAQWEIDAFGKAPLQDETSKLRAISQIGDVAPAKRMWNAMRKILEDDTTHLAKFDAFIQAYDAYEAWKDRTRIPEGVAIDPDADMTLLFCNSTYYGQMKNGWLREYPTWNTRMGGDLPPEANGVGANFPFPYGTEADQGVFRVTLLNGDYFYRAYQNVDFGGHRGWENQFKSSVKIAGSGCWFTFGRAHWSPNTGIVALEPAHQLEAASSLQPFKTISNVVYTDQGPRQEPPPRGPTFAHIPIGSGNREPVPPVANLRRAKDGLTERRLELQFQFDPGRRLRFYQFDPIHHDVAIFSIH